MFELNYLFHFNPGVSFGATHQSSICSSEASEDGRCQQQTNSEVIESS